MIFQTSFYSLSKTFRYGDWGSLLSEQYVTIEPYSTTFLSLSLSLSLPRSLSHTHFSFLCQVVEEHRQYRTEKCSVPDGALQEHTSLFTKEVNVNLIIVFIKSTSLSDSCKLLVMQQRTVSQLAIII